MRPYTIHIDEESGKEYADLLREYWLIEKNKFVFTPKEVATKNGLNQQQLTVLVKKHSHCVIKKNDCPICNEPIEKTVNSQSQFTSNQRQRDAKLILKCEECYRKKFRPKEEVEKKEKHQTEAPKYHEKKVFDLSDDDNKILDQIKSNPEKSQIYKTVFKGDPYNKEIWKKVKRLEKQGYLVVLRNGYQVIGFELSNNYLNNKSGIFSREIFCFHLEPNKKGYDFLPEYLGAFIPAMEISLKAGTQYQCFGTKNEDGTLSISIKPATYKTHNGELANEPKPIGAILKEIYRNNHLK